MGEYNPGDTVRGSIEGETATVELVPYPSGGMTYEGRTATAVRGEVVRTTHPDYGVGELLEFDVETIN